MFICHMLSSANYTSSTIPQSCRQEVLHFSTLSGTLTAQRDGDRWVGQGGGVVSVVCVVYTAQSKVCSVKCVIIRVHCSVCRVALDLPLHPPLPVGDSQFSSLVQEAACGLPVKEVLPLSHCTMGWFIVNRTEDFFFAIEIG